MDFNVEMLNHTIADFARWRNQSTSMAEKVVHLGYEVRMMKSFIGIRHEFNILEINNSIQLRNHYLRNH